MSELPHRYFQATPLYEAIAGELATSGWGIFAHALENRLANSLNVQARALESWEAAGVGRQADHQRNRFVRTDRIAWINGTDPAERAWLAWAEGLRIYLNRTLMLGTLAVYLSEVFPHEVLLTESERFSIAGWFRPRAELPLENL